MFISTLLLILGVLVSLVIVFALNAPVELLAWWTGRARCRSAARTAIEEGLPAAAVSGFPVADHYIVYLSGVGRSSGEERVEKEENFLNLVETALPGFVMVRDVFPYSVSNTPLTEMRPLRAIWQAIPRIARRSRRLMIFYHLIFFRNLLQVLVSCDVRYGRAYSYGIAKEMLRGLLRHGYRLDQPRPVTVLCISGGGLTSQAAAPYLRKWLGAPIRIISVGSVLGDDEGTLDVEHIFHLAGSQDATQYLGRVLTPGFWPVFPNSAWHRFVRAGRYTEIPIGPMHHMGYGDYFSRSVTLPDGTPFVRQTADVVIRLFKENAQLRPRLASEGSDAAPYLSFHAGDGFAEQPELGSVTLQTVAVRARREE
jgi:hypothetical protein